MSLSRNKEVKHDKKEHKSKKHKKSETTNDNGLGEVVDEIVAGEAEIEKVVKAPLTQRILGCFPCFYKDAAKPTPAPTPTPVQNQEAANNNAAAPAPEPAPAPAPAPEAPQEEATSSFRP